MIETCSTKTTRNIESLPFQDLVFPFIFKHLSLEELFALQGVNKSFRLLISLYFELMKDIDLQGIKTRKPFQVIFHAKTRRKAKHESTDCDAPDTLQSLPYNATIVNSIILSRMPMLPSSQSSDSKINHLKTLNVRGCKWFCDADLLQVIHAGAYKIQVLDVSNCFQVRMKDVKFVVTKNILSWNLIEHLMSLTTHLLPRLFFFRDQISNEMLMQLLYCCCQSIQVLRLNGCHWVSKTTLSFIGKDLKFISFLECHPRCSPKVIIKG